MSPRKDAQGVIRVTNVVGQNPEACSMRYKNTKVETVFSSTPREVLHTLIIEPVLEFRPDGKDTRIWILLMSLAIRRYKKIYYEYLYQRLSTATKKDE